MDLQNMKIVAKDGDGTPLTIPQYLDFKVDQAIKRKFGVVFTDEDVALVEFLHDRLLDVYGENINLDYMKNARELAKKIQESV